MPHGHPGRSNDPAWEGYVPKAAQLWHVGYRLYHPFQEGELGPAPRGGWHRASRAEPSDNSVGAKTRPVDRGAVYSGFTSVDESTGAGPFFRA
jgi:hypothetical protein